MRDGAVFTVTDTPTSRPIAPAGAASTLTRWLSGLRALVLGL